MPHGTVANGDEAIRYGFAVLRRGADAVYCSQSPRIIEAMAREGIPVPIVSGLTLVIAPELIGSGGDVAGIAAKVAAKVEELLSQEGLDGDKHAAR